MPLCPRAQPTPACPGTGRNLRHDGRAMRYGFVIPSGEVEVIVDLAMEAEAAG
jgi:hypothetical protein